MIEPVSTGAVIGLGWAGKKILGPSLDELGSQLRMYAGDRIKKIFAKVESSAKNTELHDLPGAFTLKFFQGASMSEENDLITSMWANLLISASESFDTRKILYLDILEKLSSQDALLLNDIIDDQAIRSGSNSIGFFLNNIKTSTKFLAERILNEKGVKQFDFNTAEEFNEGLLSHRDTLPVRILGSMVPYILQMPEDAPKNTILPTSSATGLANDTGPYDPLIRQRLIQEFDFELNVGFKIEVEGVMATALGIEFVKNCRGIDAI